MTNGDYLQYLENFFLHPTVIFKITMTGEAQLSTGLSSNCTINLAFNHISPPPHKHTPYGYTFFDLVRI